MVEQKALLINEFHFGLLNILSQVVWVTFSTFNSWPYVFTTCHLLEQKLIDSRNSHVWASISEVFRAQKINHFSGCFQSCSQCWLNSAFNNNLSHDSKTGVSLRLRHPANWLALRMILHVPAWFDNLEESVSFKEIEPKEGWKCWVTHPLRSRGS